MPHAELPWISDHLASIVAAISALIAGVSAYFAIQTYRRNVQTKSAEFVSQLHQSFFVDKTYKKIRNLLDQDPILPHKDIAVLIMNESSDFTDFLNFFELAAYFCHCGTLSPRDVEALFGYYLNLLDRNEDLRKYIANVQENGFEQLNSLLTERKTPQNKRE